MTLREAFFSRRNYSWVEPLRFNFTDTPLSDPSNMSDSTITVLSRSNAPRTLLGKHDLFEEEVEKSWSQDISRGSVNGRAWVGQEVSLLAFCLVAADNV